MQTRYFIGVDGGGTQCRTRLTNQNGDVLAACTGGPANIWSQFDNAMKQVCQLLDETLHAAGLSTCDAGQTHVVLGLAGGNISRVRAQAQAWPHAYASWQVFSDVEIACPGAHNGQPGAVLITGTGSQGAVWSGQAFRCVGGWGMALSDQGSGAWLGQRALRLALKAHENLVEHTPLTRALMAHFGHEPETLLAWSVQATPAQWGQFAPQIFQAASEQDSNGVILVAACAQEISELINNLSQNGRYPVAMLGGLALPIYPWLSADVQAMLVTAEGDALSGALRLARLCA
ncbi:BadF/BadG/BcrA/BcrD ATPase family protein [Mangrovibacter yixingensis]|uniref:BadF/BadG/BcrA/BcrD ATPase family protein n=1 Tax=Mangrovibacter yixingensis TaxID=1529639 RepID=UPI001CFB8708|nr:BadF/BadG/BcrA/BcrD ATPase family protein [Mangrovibacter yixingensis]